jgi:hypothetical protein
MIGQDEIRRGYTIAVRQPVDSSDGYHVLYAPRSPRSSGTNGDAPCLVPSPFEAVVRVQGEEVAVTWANVPKDATQEFTQDASTRVRTLHDWLARHSALVSSVETWMKDLDWATRRIETTLEDAQIGKYKAPALLMQEGIARILLEPIGRSAPGTEGVVDLYLMPAYDDIASLYYYDGRWNLHHVLPGTVGSPNTRQAPPKLLSKDTLLEVLEEMRRHAA